MVAALLRSRAGVSCDVIVIKTSGDRLADAPLAQIGGKRVFVKEIEDALLDGAVDLKIPARLSDADRAHYEALKQADEQSRRT